MPTHERIDPRRGPGRERDDGRREIDAGVSEYEEDRDAQRVDEYDSNDDWGFNWAEDFPDDEDHPEDSLMADARDQAYHDHEPEPDFDDADITASVEDNRIVIEVPIPAGTSPERWGKIVEDLTRRIAVKRTDADHRIRSAEPTPEAL